MTNLDQLEVVSIEVILFNSSGAGSSNGKFVDETTRDNKRPSRQKPTTCGWVTQPYS